MNCTGEPGGRWGRRGKEAQALRAGSGRCSGAPSSRRRRGAALSGAVMLPCRSSARPQASPTGGEAGGERLAAPAPPPPPARPAARTPAGAQTPVRARGTAAPRPAQPCPAAPLVPTEPCPGESCAPADTPPSSAVSAGVLVSRSPSPRSQRRLWLPLSLGSTTEGPMPVPAPTRGHAARGAPAPAACSWDVAPALLHLIRKSPIAQGSRQIEI